MVGFPGETKEDINSTFSLVLQLLEENKRTKISPIYAFTPYPGTKLFDTALKSGLMPPQTLEGWSCYDWKTINLPWITKKEKKYFESLYFWSIFLDDKYELELPNLLLKKIIKHFLPILKKIAILKIRNPKIY